MLEGSKQSPIVSSPETKNPSKEVVKTKQSEAILVELRDKFSKQNDASSTNTTPRGSRKIDAGHSH